MATNLSLARSARDAAVLSAAIAPGEELTPSQRATLEAWPGWGPVAPMFNDDLDSQWQEIDDDLREALPASAFEAIRSALDTSFYTPPELARHVWNLIVGRGFAGGSVLDLGCGHGRFLSAAPEGLPLTYTGVDCDETATGIARLLHPGAEWITSPLQKVTLPQGRFDLAVGNVPFASGYTSDGIVHASTLHDYFLQRAVAAVRPGGFVAVFTSRYALDNLQGLSSVAGKAKLVSAIRLPSGAFAGQGTDTVIDLLVLQVGDFDRCEVPEGAGVYGAPLVHTPEGCPAHVRLSEWWSRNSALVAGQMETTTFFRSPLQVTSDNPARDIQGAFSWASAMLPSWQEASPAESWTDDIPVVDAEGRFEGELHIIDEQVHRVENGVMVPHRTNTAELKTLIGLRDAALRLVEAEADTATPDAVLDPLRADALARYERYVSTFGALNRGKWSKPKVDEETGTETRSWRRPPMGGFRADPHAELVLGLEVFDNETGTHAPAPILLQRVHHAPQRIDRADSPAHALAVCRAELGRIDLDRIAELLQTPRSEVVAALGDDVFTDPVTFEVTEARDYLAGNIADKLDAAREAAADFDEFNRNVAALERVMPEPIKAVDIRVSFGAPWLETGDIKAFCSEALGASSVTVNRAPEIAAWEISLYRTDPAVEAQYSTSRMSVAELVAAGLNGNTPVVHDEVSNGHGGYRKVRNHAESALAATKLADLTSLLREWIWSDGDRAERVAAEYNRRFNSTVPVRGDGSWLSIPGLSSEVTPWKHQTDFIDRAMRQPRIANNHQVGAGKTLSAVGLAMTLRAYGIVSRPLLTVPKSVLDQIARDARRSFPTGKFLVATAEQMKPAIRQRFWARAATGDWDLIICSHETFTALGASKTDREQWVLDEISRYEAALRDSRHGFRAKRVAAALRGAEGRLERLRESRHDDNAMTLDVLGIDHIGVDESHYFKGLHISTRADGLSIQSSMRANDLHMKVAGLARRFPGRPILSVYSGSPFLNQLSELFSQVRLCAPWLLEQSGTDHFDAWAATFCRYVTEIETTADGMGLRSKTRPSVLQNAPEARGMLAQFSDMLDPDSLPGERPEVTRHKVAEPANEAQVDYMSHLAERLDKLPDVSDPSIDNILKIGNEGRAVALDPRLLGVAAASPKLAAAATGIADHYHRHADDVYAGSPQRGTFQLVCMDLGTPKGSDSQSYGRLRDLLVAHGVPADRIRFIHDAGDNEAARASLFSACRDGSVNVLIGSSRKCGVGVNIQRRLSALWHVDQPWNPALRSQREGRAVRPGNLNAHVDIYDCIAEHTFDSVMYGTVLRKARMLSQLISHASLDREVAALDGDTLNLAEAQAAASGNPLLAEHSAAQAAASSLRAQRNAYRGAVSKLLRTASSRRSAAADLRLQADGLDAFMVDDEAKAALRRDLADDDEFNRTVTALYRDYNPRFGGIVFSRTAFGSLQATHRSGTALITEYIESRGRVSKRATAAGLRSIAGRLLGDLSSDADELRHRAAEVDEAAERDEIAADKPWPKEAEYLAAERELDRTTAALDAEAETLGDRSAA